MAAVELLPIAAGAATSADFNNAAGASMTIALKSTDGSLRQSCNATIQFKNSTGSYTGIGAISGDQPMKVLTAVGTFRVVKDAAAESYPYGVDTQVA